MVRTKRKGIEGRTDYTVCTNGIVRKWGRKVEVHTDYYPGLPTFTMDGIDYHHLVDETTLKTFRGWPHYPDGTTCGTDVGFTVVHADGDPANNRLDNLSWLILPEWLEYTRERISKSLMRASNLRHRIMPSRTN